MNKSEYNKQYYLKRQSELKEKAKEREREKRTEKAPPRRVPFYLFLPIIAVSTFLLLSEMATFYESWIRAGVLEGLVLTFSVMTHPSFIRRFFYKAVAIGICALSIYGMSSKYLEQGIMKYREEKITERQIAELEKVIQDKQDQKSRLMDREWITAARKSDQLIDDLRIRLDSLRASFLKVRPMILHSTVIQILCRVFLMLGNVLLIQRMFEKVEISDFSLKFQKESLKGPNVINIRRA